MISSTCSKTKRARMQSNNVQRRNYRGEFSSQTKRSSELGRIGQETLSILERGGYGSDESFISVADALCIAVSGTATISSEFSTLILANESSFREQRGPLVIEVTEEKTQEAARRLLIDERKPEVVLLNFASAKNRGGGFLKGARAQEEDLCRSSGLFACLSDAKADEYYSTNHRCSHLLYTDTMIYSPNVPFFRCVSSNTLDLEPCFPSVITCPAPNAIALSRPWPLGAGITYEEVFRTRIGKVLAVAEQNGHRNLVLGAWGCGVFGNSSEMVASLFCTWLQSDRFKGSFDHVVFAVYGGGRSNVVAFKKVFEK